MNNRKAQSAMEYLMTYGWAILVVLIALGALFYLGVFNPKTSNSCIAGAPITCSDVKVQGITFQMSLGATGVSSTSTDNQITIVSLTTPSAINCNSGLPDDISTSTISLAECTLSTAVSAGAKFAGTANVKYKLQGSTAEHNLAVQVSGTAE